MYPVNNNVLLSSGVHVNFSYGGYLERSACIVEVNLTRPVQCYEFLYAKGQIIFPMSRCLSCVAVLHSVLSDSAIPRAAARQTSPCPSLSPSLGSNSCLLSQ